MLLRLLRISLDLGTTIRTTRFRISRVYRYFGGLKARRFIESSIVGEGKKVSD